MSAGDAARLVDIYAHTLLDLAVQSRALEPVAADLDTLSALMEQEPDFKAFLASPYFSELTRRDLVRRVFAGRLHELTLNFLAVVIDHDRGMLLNDIIDRYQQLYRAHQGYQAVEVAVAQALSEAQRAKLAQDLAAALQARVDLNVRVDPSLIGGVVIRYGDKMLDNSLKGRLTRIVGRLANSENKHKRQLMMEGGGAD